MYNTNLDFLIKMITKKIGFTVSNKQCANEILENNKENATTKELVNVVFQNGILNCNLIFV